MTADRIGDEFGQQLSWRIPVEESHSLWRSALLRILFPGLMVLAVVLALAPAEIQAPSIVGILGVGLFLYWRLWRARRRNQEDNIRIDDGGVHWRDFTGAWERFSREQILGFRLGLDADTERVVAALTFLLVGGFESQPLEVHAPASPQAVRGFLSQCWGLEDVDHPPDEKWASRLDRTLQTIYEQNPAPETRRLQRGRIFPQQQENGGWTIFQHPLLGEIEFDIQTCRFRLRRRDAAPQAYQQFEEIRRSLRDEMTRQSPHSRDEIARQITQHLDDAPREWFAQWLAGQILWDITPPIHSIHCSLQSRFGGRVEFEGELVDAHDRWDFWGQAGPPLRELASTVSDTAQGHVYLISARQLEQGREQWLADSRRVGFRAEFDEDAYCWRLSGAKDRLLEICRELKRIADEFSSVSPPGARPQRKNLGGDVMQFFVQLSSRVQMTPDTLAAPPEVLRRFTDQSQAQIGELVGNDIAVQFPSTDPPVQVIWTITDDGG